MKPHNEPFLFSLSLTEIPPVLLDLERTEVLVQQPLPSTAGVRLVQTELGVLQAVVAAEEDGEGVRHRRLPGDDDALVHRVSSDLVVVNLHHPPGLGPQDELPAAPGVAGDELCRAGGILQGDGLQGVVDPHLHGEVVQLGVPVTPQSVSLYQLILEAPPVSHPEPDQQPRDHLPAGRLHTDHDRLVGEVGPQTVGVHPDGVGQTDGLPVLRLTQTGLALQTVLPRAAPGQGVEAEAVAGLSVELLALAVQGQAGVPQGPPGEVGTAGGGGAVLQHDVSAVVSPHAGRTTVIWCNHTPHHTGPGGPSTRSLLRNSSQSGRPVLDNRRPPVWAEPS